MGIKVGEQTVIFENPIYVRGFYSIVGQKEGNGSFRDFFDYVLKDDLFDEKTYEKAERKMIEQAVSGSIDRANVNISDVDLFLSGDLLDQIISSSFAARHFNIPHIGLYSACSIITQGLALGACLLDGSSMKNILCATGSHFSSAERQFRFPLELGNQRPPTSQWTVTGAGSTLLSKTGKFKIKITKATFGKVTDYGIKDVNNLGAVMAPAAMATLIAHFKDTKTKPSDYDLILTGDLGKLGSELLRDLMEYHHYELGSNYGDCGHMIFSRDQKTFQGASGSGCSAAILNSYVFKKIEEGVYKKVLMAATGALLSTLSSQQGESIPGICHAVVFERDEGKADKKTKGDKK